jgi:hypothetical protein
MDMNAASFTPLSVTCRGPPRAVRSAHRAAELSENRLHIVTMKPQRLKALHSYCWNTVRRLGYVAILISLWRAPVPCVHRHASPTAASSIDAIDHQCVFHDGSLMSHECEWHLHIAFLDDVARSGGMPVRPAGQPREPANQVFFSARSGLRVISGSTVAARLPARLVEFGMLCEAKACSFSRHPSHPALAAGRLLTLLCVARC